MSSGCVIGVDLGGTKLLAGAVDEQLNVHHRAARAAGGTGRAEVLDSVVAAVQEVRAAVSSEVRGVGFGIPCLIDTARGMAVMAVNLPIADVPFADLMTERLGLPVFVDNDANTAMLAEWRFGAARGAQDAVLLTIGTGIGGGLVVGGQIARGALGAGAELGHMVIQADGPRCQGNCPNRGCLESLASGTALAREALRVASERPESGLGRALASGRDIGGPLVTELAHDGDAAALDVLALIGGRLGVGIANLVNIFNPDVVVVGGGVIAAGDLLLAPARAVVAERALSPSKEHARIVPARFGAESGMLGAAALALVVLGPGTPTISRDDHHFESLRRPPHGFLAMSVSAPDRMPGRLVVCPTPIGNLEDITLRVLSALREADVVACEDTRRTRVLLDRYGVSGTLISYHEHNEAVRAEELVARMLRGDVVALVSDAGMPLVSDPGFVLVRACVSAGLAIEVLPGPSAALAALVASALPADTWRFVGFLPRSRRELDALFTAPETLVAFESPRRLAASLAVLAERDPERPVAVCRELTKLHEEVVRGAAGELAARYASAAPRGEVVLVTGGAPPSAPDLAPALAALRRLVEAGAKPRAAASVVAELTGTRANALYRALVEEETG